MSIGTAIFLGAALIALVLLYNATKDRWRWRIVIGRILGVLLLLIVVATALIAVNQYWPTNLTPVERQTQYWGIKLGLPATEVLYMKGSPENVFSEPDAQKFKEVLQVSKLPTGKTVHDYREWSFSQSRTRYDVAFDKGMRVVAIQCYSSDKLYNCPEIAGIRDGSSEEQMINRFGQGESKITGLTKRMNYDAQGVYFYLEKEVVYLVGVIDARWTPD